jgi:SAM-dependent methyltransferase
MGKSQTRIQKEWYSNVKARYSLSLAERNNEMHLKRLKELLDNGKIDAPVLEIGCSSGWYTEKFDPNTYAVDISIEGIRKDRNFVVANAEQLPFRNNTFGLVYGFGIIHHLEDIDKGFREAYRVLKPEGRIAFGAENHAFCPANYVFPLIYGNWHVEKGFTRITKDNTQRKLLGVGFTDFRFGYGGFAIYGMNRTVYVITKKIEDIVSKSPSLHKMAGFMYFTAKKLQ